MPTPVSLFVRSVVCVCMWRGACDWAEWLTGQAVQGVGEKGLSYQAELSSVLQAALSFQPSCTLTGSLKKLSLSAGYHLELRRGRGSNTDTDAPKCAVAD